MTGNDGDPSGSAKGSSFTELVAVMDRLRSPGGCPWDAEQTHQSLVEYLIEESHEVVEAIEKGTAEDLVEELGDLLLQVVFHARIGQEESPGWDIDDVSAGITAKLVRRHPHVFADQHMFADQQVGSSDELERQWHAQKVAEKQRDSVLDGIPAGLPGLARTAKIRYRTRAADVDLEVDQSAQQRVADLFSDDDSADLESEIGELLLAVALLAQDRGVDPESALRKANRRLEQRIREGEVD